MIHFKEVIHPTVKMIEGVLAVGVIAAVMVYMFNSLTVFAVADWHSKDTFYELIYRVLLTTIGLELARMLVTHNYLSILELMAFVVARKMLKPETTTVEVALGIVSFILILVANKYLIDNSPVKGKKLVHRL